MIEVVEIGPHVLVWGDAKDCLKLRPWDRLFADPPYLFKASGGGKYRKARPNGLDAIEEAKLNEGFDQAWLIEQLWSTSAPAAMVFCHGDQVGRLETAMHTPFRRVVLLQWYKINPQPVANKNYLPDTEYVVHGWNPGAHPVGDELYDLRRWIATAVGRNEFGHPTQKPLDVMRKFLVNLGGETICDPYMGTGSTGVAAVRLGKTFFGIEKERRWFDVAVERVRTAYQAAP